MNIKIGDITCDIEVIAAVSKPEYYGMDSRGLNPCGWKVRWWTLNQGGCQEMPPAKFLFKHPPPNLISADWKSIKEDEARVEQAAHDLHQRILSSKGWI